jgi:hypothetical protein
MIKPRLVLCSGAVLPDGDAPPRERQVIELATHGMKANVHLRLEDVARVLLEHLSPRLVDLLEIAAYVFAADSATRRGTEWSDEGATEPWDRDFRFVVPVRDLSFWSRGDVSQLLVEVLKVLADDTFVFDFRQLSRDWSTQEYLEFGDKKQWPFQGVDRVLMFSGGLDSLAGAVETAADGGPIVLVSHRSVGAMDSRQRRLFRELRKLYANRMIRVPVWVNKEKNFGREHTQRTRSFLFAALGTAVAESMGAGGVRFFENGIVSLNLPIADEVLRARASRTTHPVALELLSKLLGLVTERPFIVDNPYLFKTKTEVVSILNAKGASRLIPYTCSCTVGDQKQGTPERRI